MRNSALTKMITAAGLAATLFTLSVPAVHAGNHFAPPGIQPCFNPGGCPPPNPGGLINPPAPPGPGGGGGGGGGFGSGLGAGIGLGVGLGIVNSLTRPRTVIVQQQPTYVAPAPQVIHSGISAHDQFCLNKFNSYNIQTKRYLSFSGKYRLCISPYM